MCGFFATFSPDAGQRSLELQARLAEALEHRGPDDFQTLHLDGCHVLFWRLSIVDVAGGRQPMNSADGQTTVVYNGEIYNYKALKRGLVRRGHTFRTESDTEVLLRAYEEWGVTAFSRFEGMFAACIIDRCHNRVVLARDVLGVKPLYFAADQGRLVIASEQKAILADRQTPCLDRSAFTSYLLLQTVPDSRTFFSGISKVPPGMVLEFAFDCLQPLSAEPIRRRRSVELRRYVDYRRSVRRTIVEQVRLATDTELSACFHLSGGIDSNLLVGLSRRLHPGRSFTCVSSYVEGPADPEFAHIRQAAEHHGVRLKSVDVNAETFFDAIDDVLYYLDEPVGDPGVVAQFLVNRLASEEAKIVYSGQGLDEMFFGYSRDLAAYTIEQHGSSALVPGSPAFQRINANTRQFFRGWEEFLRPLAAVPMAPDLALFRKLCRLDAFDSPPGLHKEVLQALRQTAFDYFSQLKSRTTGLNEFMLETEISVQLPSLLHMEDRASMRHSIEGRVPFCTASILDLARRSKLSWTFANGQPKGVLRDAFKDVIPQPILERRQKVGRPIPFRRWLAGREGAPFLDDLRKKREMFYDLLKMDFVTYALDHPNPRDRSAWAAVSLSRWIDLYDVSLP